MVLVSAGFVMVFGYLILPLEWILVETATFYILLRVCQCVVSGTPDLLGGNYRDAGNDDISEAIEDTLNLFFG